MFAVPVGPVFSFQQSGSNQKAPSRQTGDGIGISIRLLYSWAEVEITKVMHRPRKTNPQPQAGADNRTGHVFGPNS